MPAVTPENMAKLQISCRGLAKMDFLGKSDPYVEVYEYRVLMDVYVKIGETEVQLKVAPSILPAHADSAGPNSVARVRMRGCTRAYPSIRHVRSRVRLGGDADAGP